MSLVTAVILGNEESECAKLGSDAILDVGLRDDDDDDDMVVARETLELEEVVEDRLLVAMVGGRAYI